MSFRRHLSIAQNRNTYLDNRLTDFTNVPMYTYDLTVKRNASIAGDLAVGGNLTVARDIRAANFYASGNFYLDNYILIPAGTIIMSGAINAPNGWLPCDGRILAKIDYYDLWLAIGNVYTDISSATEFKVPNMKGRCPVGAGHNTETGLTARTLGTYDGSETHTLTVAEMPSHDHSGNTGINGSHTHSSNATAGNTGYGLAYRDGNSTRIDTDYSYNGEINLDTMGALSIDSAGSHNHSITAQGGGLPHNNMQPFMVVRYLIKY